MGKSNRGYGKGSSDPMRPYSRMGKGQPQEEVPKQGQAPQMEAISEEVASAVRKALHTAGIPIPEQLRRYVGIPAPDPASDLSKALHARA